MRAESIRVFGLADPESFPLQKKRHSDEFLRGIAHLRMRTNKYGAIAGMLSGTATVLIWHNLVKPLGGIFAIYELLPAFIVSLLFIVVISLLTPAPSAEVLHEFDHYLDDPDDRHVDDDLVAAEIAAGEKRSQI